MAEGVVDELEAVEIGVEHGEGTTTRGAGRDTCAQPFVERDAVREAGEGVTPGILAKLDRRALPLVDVGEGSRDVPHVPVGAAQGACTEERPA